MTKNIARAAFTLGALTLLIGANSETSWSQAKVSTTLFKVVTDKDDVIIGLNPRELQALGTDQNAGGVARSLAERKSLTVWQYSVRHGASGALELAPLHQIGLLANQSVRVEPYSSPLTVVAHD